MTGSEAELINLADEELFAVIGQDVAGRAGAQLPYSDYVSIGKEWFESRLSHLQSYVCAPELSERLLRESDEGKLVRELVDLLGSLLLGVRPAAIATLIVRIGLRRFCLADGA
jgi:hypothetical protein